MRRFLLVFAAILGVLGVLEPRLAAQKEGQLFIKIVGPDGKPVEDLKAGEVTITENGADCKTVKVEPIDWPMKLQILIDNGKVNTNPINPLRDGLTALFDAIPEGVEVSIYTTAPQPRPILKPTTDKTQLLKAMALIATDNGAGAFFDALSEATGRTDKEKTPHFPVILMVGSDIGRNEVRDRDFQKMQENVIKHAMTVHVIVASAGAGAGASGGAIQTELGLNLTKLSGGRYENITAGTRLATLLPEFGKRIAESHAKQGHQFRVTYERPTAATVKPGTQVGAVIARPGAVTLTIDGHMP
jgi:hypothetical protein